MNSLRSLGLASAAVLLTNSTAVDAAARSGAPVVPALGSPGSSSNFDDTEWLAVEGPPSLEFPRDHGAHADYRTEWWYLTATLATASGDRAGVQFTIFRQGIDGRPRRDGESPLRARHVYSAHLAVVREGEDTIRFAERVRRGVVNESSDDPHLALAGAADDELSAWVDNWSFEQIDDDTFRVRARDVTTAVDLDLTLTTDVPPVLQGESGYSQKGADPGNASAYVSMTRMALEGTLRTDDLATAVSGTGWFDHEWGTSQLGPGVAGWDWFGLHLNDGRELMLYSLRRADGSSDPFSSGTLVEPDGRTVHLERDQFTIEHDATWTSPSSEATYPCRWRLRVPEFAIDLVARPWVANCELDGSTSTGVTYWEGPVDLLAPGGGALGSGYAELTGYAQSLTDRF